MVKGNELPTELGELQAIKKLLVLDLLQRKVPYSTISKVIGVAEITVRKMVPMKGIKQK